MGPARCRGSTAEPAGAQAAPTPPPAGLVLLLVSSGDPLLGTWGDGRPWEQVRGKSAPYTAGPPCKGQWGGFYAPRRGHSETLSPWPTPPPRGSRKLSSTSVFFLGYYFNEIINFQLKSITSSLMAAE